MMTFCQKTMIHILHKDCLYRRKNSKKCTKQNSDELNVVDMGGGRRKSEKEEKGGRGGYSF